MKFNEVGEQSLKDPGFARKLSQAAINARRDGVGSAAWKKLAKFFAENDDELRLLTPPIGKSNNGVPDTTTTSTLLILSDTGAGTTTTMTATTTSRLCSLPGICPKKATKARTKRK